MPETPIQVYQGGCQCRAIRYEADGPPIVVALCYCEACQRGSGTGHTTSAMFPADKFRLTGPIAQYSYIADNGNQVVRVFCPTCGSPVYGRNSGTTDYVSLTLGTFDVPFGFEPQVAIFTHNRNSWDAADDRVIAYERQPDWKPDDGG